MEEHAFAGPSGERNPPRRVPKPVLSLEIGPRRFPILSIDADSCMVETLPVATLRGYARILDGENLLATCLITLAAREGPAQRIVFKQRTEARLAPPVDYAR